MYKYIYPYENIYKCIYTHKHVYTYLVGVVEYSTEDEEESFSEFDLEGTIWREVIILFK